LYDYDLNYYDYDYDYIHKVLVYDDIGKDKLAGEEIL
jgi:hypothetical protein